MKRDVLLFTDFDGTLYDPSVQILLSPFYNKQTTSLLRKIDATFIIVTGRPSWSWVDEVQLKLLSLPRPEIVVYGGGTHILRRNTNGTMVQDEKWQNYIKDTKVVWSDPMAKPHRWQKNLIEETLQPVLDHWILSFMNINNPFLSVISITNFQVKHIKRLLDQIKMYYKKGIHTFLTEKLYLPNSIDLFNGYVVLVPERVGKHLAAEHILKEYKVRKPNALFFGDALIDVPMLSFDATAYTHASYSYGIHMTPLALENMKIEDPKSKIVHFKGSAPKAFGEIIKAYADGKPIAAQQHAKLVEPA